jgi:hypothetical protein
VISFCRWTVRLFLLVALYLLLVMFQAIWPTERSASWMELVGIGALAVAGLSVSLWAAGAWLDDR